MKRKLIKLLEENGLSKEEVNVFVYILNNHAPNSGDRRWIFSDKGCKRDDVIELSSALGLTDEKVRKILRRLEEKRFLEGDHVDYTTKVWVDTELVGNMIKNTYEEYYQRSVVYSITDKVYNKYLGYLK